MVTSDAFANLSWVIHSLELLVLSLYLLLVEVKGLHITACPSMPVTTGHNLTVKYRLEFADDQCLTFQAV